MIALFEKPKVIALFEVLYPKGVHYILNRYDAQADEVQPDPPVVASHASFEEVLQLAATVYAGLSDEEIAEIEQIALQRHDFFGDNL